MIPLPIANGLYVSRSLPISNQCCKNWYPSIVQTEGLSQQVLFGTPGLEQIAYAGGTSRINRGSHTIEGIPYFVQGDRLYNVTKSSSLGVVSYTANNIGEIAGTGRVSMADNGSQLMIVSDEVGYLYTPDNPTGWYPYNTLPSLGNHIAYSSYTGLYAALTTSGTTVVATSQDGITWTARTAPSGNFQMLKGRDGGGASSTRYIAVGSSVAMYSKDGITWTESTPSTLHLWRDVAGGPTIYVAVSDAGDATNSVMKSTDGGATWSNITSFNVGWRGIATDDSGTYVAVGENTNKAMYSTNDGTTWTQSNNHPFGDWTSIAYGDGLWVATSNDADLAPNNIITSPDGITWTTQTGAVTDSPIVRVYYLNDKFWAVGDKVQSSSDGVTWATVDVTPGFNLTSLAYGYSPEFDNNEQVFVGTSQTGIDPLTGDTYAAPILRSRYGGNAIEVIGDYDPDFLANGAPQQVRFVDSYFAVTTDDKKWIRCAANNGIDWNALDFGTAEADPDDIQAIGIDNNDVYLFGTETIESFDNVGGSGFGRENH